MGAAVHVGAAWARRVACGAGVSFLFHSPVEMFGRRQRNSCCLSGKCLFRWALEKETSIVSGDGWIHHGRLPVNIHDVIFSLRGRLCLRASAIAARVVSV